MCFFFGMEGKDNIFSFVYIVHFKKTDNQNNFNFCHFLLKLIFARTLF